VLTGATASVAHPAEGSASASVSTSTSAGATARPAAPDARVEFDPRFDSLVYRDPLAQSEGVAADGAAGTNILWERHALTGWVIEVQDHADEAIIGGLARHRPRVWKAGLREYDWGFAHQGRDGSFLGTANPFHSTSFFVAAVAHTILVLRHSRRVRASVPARVIAHVERYLPKLHAAATWMARADVWNAGLAGDAPFTHRRYLVADAVGLSGLLTHDKGLMDRADQALALGLSAQRRDGVNPELDGFDSSYQAVGLMYAQRYLAWLPHERLARRLSGMIRRGLAWERTRVLASGEVSASGNTRTAGQERIFNGSTKTVSTGIVARVLAWWAIEGHRRGLLALARRVAHWAHAHPSASPA
jgi:hypothetical protein